MPEPQRDGRTALSPTPLAFIDHLAALIPPPRRHRHRYHGVLAPHAPLRLAATADGRPSRRTPARPAARPPGTTRPSWPYQTGTPLPNRNPTSSTSRCRGSRLPSPDRAGDVHVLRPL
ncbi:MAG: transposase [Chromatiaceae bacterium]|nr:transposase [Chromatiaceae bacterium]